MPEQIRIGWRSGVSSTPILDIMSAYPNTIAGAWGFRKLRTAYNGSCFTVRRSYDNTEMEIGFSVTGSVDESTLSSFINEGVTLNLADVENWDSAYTITDTDATAFITATGLTASNQITAVRRLVSALKFEGIWTKMKAIYPFVGGNATAHKFNLKDARDIDAAYRLTFNGGWTHGASGATPNGTNGWANTNLVMSSVFTPNNSAMGVYIQNDTNYANNGWDITYHMTEMGCMGNATYTGTYDQTGRSGVAVKIGSVSAGTNARMLGGINGFVHSDGICVTDAKGFTMFNRTSSAIIKMQKNDQLSTAPITRVSLTNNGDFLPTIPMSLGVFSLRNSNGTITYGGWSNRIQSFAFISDGLTDLEGLKLSRIIERFQSDLGRSVLSAEFRYDAGVGFVKTLYDQGPGGIHFRMNTQHAQPVIARNGVLLKDSNKLTMELNGLFSGMISEEINVTSALSFSSLYMVGSKVGIGSWSGNNMGDDGHIMSTIPSTKSTTDWQASQFYLPTKLGLYTGARDLANHNSYPTFKIYPSWIGGYALYPSNFSVSTGQPAILNWFSTGGGNAIMITKESTESTNLVGFGPAAFSGKLSLGWYSTVNPYNHFSNIRISELLMMKSSYSGNYYSGADASIYFKSQFLKNQADYYGILSIPTVDDQDAQNFVTQLGLNQTEATAINTFVKGLKTEGLWDKLVSIMPFVGNTKYKQAFNLKTPHWNKRISFGTTTAHDATGFTSNGTTEGMANAGIGLNATFTWNNIHMAAYVSNMTSGGHSMGSSSGTPTYLTINPTYKAFALSSWSIVAGNGVGVNNSTSAGFYIGNSLSTTMKLYENGTAIVTGTAVSTTLNTTYNAHVGGSGDSRQSAKFKYASYGYGLTDAQAAAYSILVNNLLVELGKI